MNRSKFKRSVVDYSLLNAQHPIPPPNEHFLTALGHKALVRFGIAHAIHEVEASEASAPAATKSGLRRTQASTAKGLSPSRSSSTRQAARPPASPFVLVTVGGYTEGGTPPPVSSIPPSPALPPSVGTAPRRMPQHDSPTALKHRFARHTASSAGRSAGGLISHPPPRRRDTAAGVADAAADAVQQSHAVGTPARVSAAERAIALAKVARRTATMDETRFQSLMALAADEDDGHDWQLAAASVRSSAESKSAAEVIGGRGLLRERPAAMWGGGRSHRKGVSHRDGTGSGARMPPRDAFHLDEAGRQAAEALVSAGADVRSTIARAKANLEAIIAGKGGVDGPSEQGTAGDSTPVPITAAARGVGAGWREAHRGGHGPISAEHAPLHPASVLYERNELSGKKQPLVVSTGTPPPPLGQHPLYALTHSPPSHPQEPFADTYGVDLQLLQRAQSAVRGSIDTPSALVGPPPLVGQTRFVALQQLGMQAGKTEQQYESAVPKGLQRNPPSLSQPRPSSVAPAPLSPAETARLGAGTSGVLSAMRAGVAPSPGPVWGGQASPQPPRVMSSAASAVDSNTSPPTASMTSALLRESAATQAAADTPRRPAARPAWVTAGSPLAQSRATNAHPPSPSPRGRDSPRSGLPATPRRRPPSTPPASRNGGGRSSPASTASVHASLAEAAASTAAMAQRMADKHAAAAADRDEADTDAQVQALQAQVQASAAALADAARVLNQRPLPGSSAPVAPSSTPSTPPTAEVEAAAAAGATTVVCLQLELEEQQLHSATVADLTASVAEALACEPVALALPSGQLLAPPDALLSSLGVAADVTLHVTVPVSSGACASPQSPGDAF